MLLTNNKMSIRSLSDILNHSQTIEKDKRFIEKCTIEKSLTSVARNPLPLGGG